MNDTFFCELDDGLICVTGDDAVAFVHAQLTSDVAGLDPLSTQYSGYCSPKGRLLTTFLLWRLENEIVLQLPAAMREGVQARISRYVLRAKAKLADARPRLALFGVAGAHARAAIATLSERVPEADHRVAAAAASHVTRVPLDRYLVLAAAANAGEIRATLASACTEAPPSRWRALDVEAGVPIVTERSQDEFVPQMVNLDLVGGVSYSKGCYPGQEIVARTHYLGRLKQRMYRVRVPGVESLAAGAPLYSPEFGPDQASGAILYSGGPGEALAVIQKSSADSQSVRFGALDGPAVELLPLPYTLPA